MKVLLWLGLLTTITASAQQRELDSLLREVQHHPQQDTLLLDMLNDIAFYYQYIDPAKGLTTTDRAITLAQQLHQMKRLAAAYNYRGQNYHARNQDSMALVMYNQALDIHTKAGNMVGQASIMNNMAIVYVDRSDYHKALDYHFKALPLIEQSGSKNRLAACYNNIGVVYQSIPDYPKALEYFLKALPITEALNDKNGMHNAYNNIGITYKNLDNYSKGLEYYNKALTIAEETGNKRGISDVLNNIGVVYEALSNNTKALDYYQRSLALQSSLGNQRGMANCYTNMGILYQKLHDYAHAMDYFKKAMTLYRLLDDQNNLATAYHEIGKVVADAPAAFLTQQGIAPGRRYALALQYQQQALQMAKDIDALDNQGNAWEAISHIYEKQGNGIKALEAYKNFVVIRDSIMNDEKKTAIARKEIQFDFDKKETLLKAAHDQKEALAAVEVNRQRIVRNAAVGIAAIVFITAVLVFVFYKRRRDAEKQVTEVDFKREVAETEMKALRAQMNPHFIFNSLNSISDYMAKNDIEAADKYLTRFARVMRLILENSELKEVPLADDLRALELYMQLEALRLKRKFTYEIKVADDIDAANTLVPPLILQPFVENSIWHGIAKKQGEGKILVQVTKEGNMIRCVVEDNGVGNAASIVIPSGTTGKKSLGMKITQARIDILNKTKKSQAGITLSHLQEGTRVEVTLPLELHF